MHRPGIAPPMVLEAPSAEQSNGYRSQAIVVTETVGTKGTVAHFSARWRNPRSSTVPSHLCPGRTPGLFRN